MATVLRSANTLEDGSHLDTVGNEQPRYDCPLYRTTARYGVLSTTGHSTNFIIMVSTPIPAVDAGDHDHLSQKTRKSSERTGTNHWVKRGAAMICSLNN